MSVKKRQLKKLERGAILLAAFFVVFPLAVHPIQKFVKANRNSTTDHGPEPWHWYEWATLGVLLFQAWIFRGQARIADQQRRLMKHQVKVAKAQTNLSREVFIASHRPKLHVRHVWIDDRLGAFTKHAGFGFNDGDQVFGSLVIVNLGGSDAIIVSSEYRIFFLRSDKPPRSVYVSKDDLPLLGGKPKSLVFLENGRHILAPGESLVVQINGTARMSKREPDMRILREFSEDGWHIFVMGQITYEDSSEHGRFMGFCRVSDLTEGFRPVDDPDYEYQD